MKILIDYLTFTADCKFMVDYRARLSLFDNRVMFIVGTARNGWDSHLYFGGVHVYSDGREDFCIELSGQGCRVVDSLHSNSFDWFSFLVELLHGESVHVSRLDIALDEQDCILSYDKLVSHCRSHKYISKARKCIWIDGSEQNCLFGSSKSDTRLRIYNKALERGVDGHWFRCELQLRDDAALSFLRNLELYGDIGLTYQGVLVNYLRFTTSAPEQNHHDRCKTTSWWSKITAGAGKIKNISSPGLEYNFESLDRFIKNQCSSSIKAFLYLNGGDVESLMRDIMSTKLNDRQIMLLRNYGVKI